MSLVKGPSDSSGWLHPTIIGAVITAVASVIGVVVATRHPGPDVRPGGPSSVSAVSGPPAPATPISDSGVFSGNNPYPEGCDQVKLGMPYSAVLALKLRRGKISGHSYDFDPQASEFTHETLEFESKGADPKVVALTFYARSHFKDQLSKDAVKAFGSETVHSSMMGAVLNWPNAGGYRLELGDGALSVRSAETSQ